MQVLDWFIVIVYFVLSAAIGLYYARRAGKNISEFFLSGRSLPWWLAGTSMVATTFAADTPLAVTELVALNGIAGNWLWWNFAFGSILTVFFFARLWRRAGILTDVEFVEVRYDGRAAAFLRGFRALYLGVFMNCIIMAWVNVAMGAILEGMFDIPHDKVILYVVLAMLITAGYSAASGMWGVAVTDAVQFVLAMTGTIVLAIFVLDLPSIGGIAGLQSQLPEWTFRFVPVIGDIGVSESVGGVLALSAGTFMAYVGLQWWSSWYPGAEPGGGGYIAQRMMSAKDEKHSLFATLWFTIAHYCIRPWPWILVGLSSLVLYPDLSTADKKLGYVYAMRDYLPSGLKGLLVAAFFAAYMSTIATQLNWGTSYIINDFYKRFIHPNAPEKKLVGVSRISTIVIMLLSVVVTQFIDTISGAWTFLIEASAGLGLVLILRWFWWRVNAWSEIAAMLTPIIVYTVLITFTSIVFPSTMFIIVGITTVVWVGVTYLTPPVSASTLDSFFRRVHPCGIGWRAVQARIPEIQGDEHYGVLAGSWLAGVIMVYAALFGIGSIIFGDYLRGAGYAVVVGVCAFWINAAMKRVGFAALAK